MNLAESRRTLPNPVEPGSVAHRSPGADARAKIEVSQQPVKIIRVDAEKPRGIGVAVAGALERAHDQLALGALHGVVVTERLGRIEQAAGGVLFLDEVGEMSPAVQAKFLRVLQEREYQRLGGARTLKADVRVLAATNRNLKAAIAQGGFREDLYYRLAVFDIALPPLRDRPEDVAMLVEAFLEEIGRSVGRPAAGISQEVRDKLVAYPWPGNVRELRNAIERAVILCEGGLITSEHLPVGIAAAQAPAPAVVPAAPAGGAATLGAMEREMIVDALARAGNNKSEAARLLGLSRAQLYSRLEKHGLVGP
jgi:DNA-binding NtrC family response regulator